MRNRLAIFLVSSALVFHASVTDAQLDDCSVGVMVAYTNAANNNICASEGTCDLGNSTGLFVEDLIDSMNAAFANSNVNHHVRLVGAFAVNYDETDKGVFQIRRHFARANDGVMDEIHQLRDIVSADVSILLIDVETAGINSTVGRAYVPAAEDASEGFAWVDWRAARNNHTFTHEIGHLYGCGHENRLPTGGGLFDDSHGYKDEANEIETIMSTEDDLDRLNVFSNPSVTFPSNNGVVAGVAGERNNARVLNARHLTMARYREPPRTITLSSPLPVVFPSAYFRAEVVAQESIVLQPGFRARRDFRATIRGRCTVP